MHLITSRSASPSAPVRLDLARFIEALPGPALIVTRDKTIAAVNRAYRRSLPQTWSIVGKPCSWVSHGLLEPCDPQGQVCPLESCLNTGQTTRVVHWHCGAPEGRCEEVVSVPVGPPGDPTGLCLQMFRPLGRTDPEPPGGLVGSSLAMRRLRSTIRKTASSGVPILLTGEPGTERELVARALHRAGPRAGGPFLSFFCSGLGDGEFEYQLSGASDSEESIDQDLVEAARGGTLFLDEIVELSPGAQLLLRQRLASGSWLRFEKSMRASDDFNLILGTTHDLEEAVDRGLLFSELLPWLQRARIHIPPIRKRRGDLPLLISSLRPWLLADPDQAIDPEVAKALERLPLNDNLWELRSRLQFAIVAARGGRIMPEHLPP